MRSIRPVVLAAALVIVFPTSGWERYPQTVAVDFEVSEGTNLAFDISPDGRWIVFDLLGQLWTLPLEGGRATPLTDAIRDTAEDVDPVFSPDGRWIVFQSDRPSGKGLWLIPAEGGTPHRITGDDLVIDQYTHLQPTWSPDSREVVYTLANRIHLLDVDARTTTSLTIDRPDGEGALTQIGTPEISGDGTRLAFGTNATRAFRLSVADAASLWEVSVDGGVPTRLVRSQRPAVTPVYSPDGVAVAFFSTDSTGRWQLWVQANGTEAAHRLTDHDDLAIRRVRWTPDGSELIYSADGKLWRVARNGRAIKPIPFSARVRFARRTYSPIPLRFAEPSRQEPARGFRGLSLSPDGGRVAMLALGRIWVWEIGAEPRPIAEAPDGAYHLSWSGDGTEVVFTTGDLFAANVESGTIRQLTAMPGEEQFPAWSPDGRYIAFIHSGSDIPRPERGMVRLIRLDQGVVRDQAATIAVGRPPAASWGSDQPAWSPDSRRLLLYGSDLQGTTRAIIASIDGGTGHATTLPHAASFISWTTADSFVYVHGVQLWKAAYDPDQGTIGTPRALSDDPALYATAASNGAILYLSGDGLRLRRQSGETQSMGWPIRFVPQAAPTPTLLRNVRVVNGTGTHPTAPSDILIEGGRIRQIAAAGSIQHDDRMKIIDADGRYVVPGLIDLHTHLWTPRPAVEGWLYYGVTTIRDVGSSLAWTAALRDQIDAGGMAGPRVALGGSFFLTGDGLSKDAGLFVSDREQAARGVALVRGMGATLVKHYLDGWAGLVTVIDEAHRQGLRVTGHCGSLLPAAAAGVDFQEHAGSCGRDEGRNLLREDHVRLKSESGIRVVVGASQWRTNLELLESPETFAREDIHPFLGEPCLNLADPGRKAPAALPRFRLGTERQRQRTVQLRNSGVTLAIGTDFCFPLDVHIQLAGLVAAGYTPLEAITAATSTAAKILDASDEIGSIEVGKLADLVILDADPLLDIRNMRRVWQVVQGGRVVDRNALRDRASRVAPVLERGPSYGY